MSETVQEVLIACSAFLVIFITIVVFAYLAWQSNTR